MDITLTPVVLEIERHVAAGGWDQPPRLFALAATAELVAREPGLAAALGLAVDADEDVPGLTPVEQDEFPADRPLDDVLATLAWPEDVVGCALAVERIMLPPEAEATLADEGLDAEGLARAAAGHPGRQDVRIVVAVLRDGSRAGALRTRQHDSEQDVLTGDDLVPGLADALAATLRD